MAPGERDREQSMRIALSHDPRFESLQIGASIPVDLQFRVVEHVGHDLLGEEYCEKVLNLELKMPEDFVSSVLSGHLMDQILSIRESGNDGCTVILGTLDEIYEAIDKSNEKRLINGKFKFLNQDDRSSANASTLLRLKSFKKRSMLNGIPIFWKGDDSGFFDGKDQWRDILDLAADYLLDGRMMGFAMRPANDERELIAASFLFRDVGAKTLEPIMQQYKLALIPRKEYATPIEEFNGVGKVRASVINKRVCMFYGKV
jgi:hypothetical protein